MVTITCNCGYKAEDEGHYKVEATIWHHAIKDHGDMLKNMSVEELETIIKMNDKSMDL